MADATTDLQGTSFGPYRIIREIARGGMGCVYEASESTLERKVALKLISRQLSGDPGFVQRFQREARTLARISHPNVVSIHALGEIDGTHYIAMDFVEGPNLRQFLAGGRYFFGDLCELLRTSAAAVKAVHEAGLIHRDIKLSNVLVARGPIARLCDFGLAKSGASSADLTATGQLLGTVQYMAPELLDNEPCTERSDIYALGLLFFETLVGHNPFCAENQLLSAELIRREPLGFPPEIRSLLSPELAGLVLGMTEKKADRRPASMKEVTERLDSALGAWPSPLARQRWPEGFELENLPELIDSLIDRKRASPTEIALLLPLARERSPGVSPLRIGAALLDECLANLQAPAFRLPAPLSSADIPALEIPALEIPAIAKTPPPSRPAKRAPAAEPGVEIDPQVLQAEKRKSEIAEAKAMPPKLVQRALELERPAPAPRARLPRPPRLPGSSSGFGELLRFLFSPRKLLLAGLLAAAAYAWYFAGSAEAWISDAPFCGNSADGQSWSAAYKDLPFPESFESFRDAGIVCNQALSCWSRARPWRSLPLRARSGFPKTAWGDALASGSLLLFFDASRKTLRARNTQSSPAGQLVLGLEECVFVLRKEEAPLFRYQLAGLAAPLLGTGAELPVAAPEGRPAAPESRPAAPGAPAKKEESWNMRGWNRVMDFFSTGK